MCKCHETVMYNGFCIVLLQTKENRELTAICDELIAKVSH